MSNSEITVVSVLVSPTADTPYRTQHTHNYNTDIVEGAFEKLYILYK